MVRAGQSWRLGLFPTKEGPRVQRIGDILSDTVGVIGVWSEPISIIAGQGQGQGQGQERQVKRAKMEDQKTGGKGKGKEREKDDGPKQTRIQRDWILEQAEGDVKDLLRVVEQTSFDLDKVSFRPLPLAAMDCKADGLENMGFGIGTSSLAEAKAW